MLQLNGLSGKRESKESVEINPIVRALNTTGAIRLNFAAIEKLGVRDTEYIAVAEAGDTVYIGAGKPHTPKLDEKGNVEKSKSGKTLTEGDGYGSKLKWSTHDKPHGTASAAAAWAILRALSGKDDFKGVVEVKLGEGVEAQMPTDNELYPVHTTIMYPLELHAIKEDEEDGEEEVKKEVSEEELVEAVATEEVVEKVQAEEAQPEQEAKATEEEDWD